MLINDVYFSDAFRSDYFKYLLENATEEEISDFILYQEIYQLLETFGIFDDKNIMLFRYEGSEPKSFIFTIDLNRVISKYPELNFLFEIFDDFYNQYSCNICSAKTFSYRYYINRFAPHKCVNCSLLDSLIDIELIKNTNLKEGKNKAVQVGFALLNK